MKLTKTMGWALTVSVLAAISSMPASAQREYWGGEHMHGGDRARLPNEFSGSRWRGDIRHFDTHDRGFWRSGYWHRTFQHGRPAWWWVVGGTWYPYPQPVYPYPDPYQPPTVIMQSAPQSLPPAPAAQYWYYCEPTGGYYPYAPSCPVNWTMVPARPGGM